MMQIGDKAIQILEEMEHEGKVAIISTSDTEEFLEALEEDIRYIREVSRIKQANSRRALNNITIGQKYINKKEESLYSKLKQYISRIIYH